MTVPGLSRSLIRDRTWNFFMDAIVFAVLFAAIYAIVAIARYWFSAPVAAVKISLSPAAIPLYAFYSLVRMIVAYHPEPGIRHRIRIFRRISTSAWKRPCSPCSTFCNPFRC